MAQNNAINNATTQLTVDPGASGDSFVQLAINAVDKWRIGTDDTDDSYRIASGSALGTSDTFIVTPAGEITMPLQSAFLAYMATDQSNVTGDGTIYTITYTSEVFDQNNDFDASSTFTAPVTGRYQFVTTVYLEGITTSHTNCLFYLTTSNATYRFFQESFAPGQDVAGAYAYNGSVFVDMDSSDTATMIVRFIGGTKVVDVIGATAAGFRAPVFGGWLAC